jgi:hypothetical protein
MVYVFDDGGVLVDVIPERNTIEDAEHETLVAPASGLYEPVTFNKETQAWSGLSEDEWKKEHPETTEPSAVQQIVMQQAIEIAQIQQLLMQQSKDIAKLKGANA